MNISKEDDKYLENMPLKPDKSSQVETIAIPPPDYNDMEDYDSLETCPDCFGEGVEVVCFDDVCVGQGWCIHGDGMAPCRTCKGLGLI